MTSGNKIERFIILFVALVIVFHSIIPHHHHFDNIKDHANSKSQLSDLSKENSVPDNDATHCHAFNILIIEAVDNSLNIEIQSVNLFFSNVFFNLILQNNLEDEVKNYKISHQINIPNLFLIAQLFFRGPPSQAYIHS